MADESHKAAFESILDDFKRGLKRRDQESFKFGSLEELEKSIAILQKKHHLERQLQNLNRLKPFLEAIDQYGKVVEVFANSSIFVAFVWVSCYCLSACSCLLVY